MAKKFKTGDRVKMISGGPDMTVINYEPHDSEQVVCQWFLNGMPTERAFHQDTLKITEPPKFRTKTYLP